MNKHKTRIVTTRAVIGSGKWHQACCSCGWLGPSSYQTKHMAARDAAMHEREVAQPKERP